MVVVWGKVKGMLSQMVEKCSKSKIRILVLGFYNRGNIGDEQYKTTIPLCFSQTCKASFDFMSVDDAPVLAADSIYDIVLCGGGDIINAYFMEKVKRIIAEFTGKVYAVSVGIPYDADVSYLDLFDHVFVRNKIDADLAMDRLGKANVTMIPDVGFLLPLPKPQGVNRKGSSTSIIQIGFCLATPVYKAYADFQNVLPTFIQSLLQTFEGSLVKIYFFHFNTFEENKNESDFETTLDILRRLTFVEQRCCVLHKITKPEKMIESLQQMTMNVCMRYHSIVFSVLAKVPFIALYANKKVRTILEDIHHPQDLSFNVSQECDWKGWTSAARRALESRVKHNESYSSWCAGPQVAQVAQVAQVVTANCPRLLKVEDHRNGGQGGLRIKTLDEASLSVKTMLDAYFGYMYSTKEVMHGKERLDIGSKDPLQVSRIICYAVTGNIDDPCIWGLSENLQRDDFVLYEAIQYIHNHHIEENQRDDQQDHSKKAKFSYYPLCNLAKRSFVTIDPFTTLHLAKNVHRSGWAFVLSHMMNLSAPHFNRPHKLVVDTYMDRTFHWGMDAMLLNGVLPYRTHWVGFLHHTFDTHHSRYNCVEMFKKQPLRESLGTCKGIFVLSNYLAEQVKAALREHCLPLVDVHVLYHPTEFVAKDKMFTFERFLANPSKKVVQIGAWLRNPYAIYKLPLYEDILNPLEIKKAVLKGTNMDGYFASSEMFGKLIDFIKNGIAPATSFSYDCVSRGGIGTMDNKYISGMCETLQTYHHSVEVITNLNNEAYDDLLSQNVVFLHLQDCSAVNTVIECIVRNTILVVNRHPAIEELLGKAYPGFYEQDSLVAASLILGDAKRLKLCYRHLKQLDKSMLRIESFMKRFVEIILGMSTR